MFTDNTGTAVMYINPNALTSTGSPGSLFPYMINYTGYDPITGAYANSTRVAGPL
jgi:hypothetical protein